jgi:hypothetical protein
LLIALALFSIFLCHLSLLLFLINAIVSSGSVKLVLEPSIQNLPATFTQYRIECPYHGEYDKRLEPDGRELESVVKSDFSIDEVAPWQSLLLFEFSLSSIRSGYSLLRLLRALARLWPSRFGRLCLRKDRHIWINQAIDPFILQSHILQRFSQLVRLRGTLIFDFYLEYEKSNAVNAATQNPNELGKSLQNMTLKNKWVDSLVDPNMTIFSETEPPKSAGP